MANQKKTTALTPRELDILNILWISPTPLTASEISKKSNGILTINAIQAVLRKLLKQDLIEIADIVYSGTVLCRSYSPTQLSKERILAQFTDEFHRFQDKISTSALVASLLDKEDDAQKKTTSVRELEIFLEQYKKSHIK